MIRHFIVALGVAGALLVGAPNVGFAKDKEKKEAAADSGKPIPYHGKVAAVDATAKTFTIKGKEKDRVFGITDKTTITKDGAAADISAITVGEEVRGQATKSGDNWQAVKVMVGAKEGKAAKGKKEEAKPADSGATPAGGAPAAPGAGAAPAAGDATGAPAAGDATK